MGELNIENTAFAIVGHVGAARSMFMESIRKGRGACFEEAEQLIKQGNAELVLGEQEHLKVISREASERDVVVTMMLMHAEDQMMAAETIRDLAVEMLEMNRAIAGKQDRS